MEKELENNIENNMLSSTFTLARKLFEFTHFTSFQLPSSVCVPSYTEEGSLKLPNSKFHG